MILSWLRLLSLCLLLLPLWLAGSLAWAQGGIQGLDEGIDYRLIVGAPPYQGERPLIADVINFKCIHCRNLHHPLQEWLEKGAGRYATATLPIAFAGQADTAVRAYFVAEGLGKGPQMKEALFQAWFDRQVEIDDPARVTELAGELGLKKERFARFLNDPGITRQVEQAARVARESGVHATPALIINGRYMVSPMDHPEDLPRFFQVVEQLAAHDRPGRP
ncbi:MAG: DsbA family protein [Magnetococcus sp. WYHC-3]